MARRYSKNARTVLGSLQYGHMTARDAKVALARLQQALTTGDMSLGEYIDACEIVCLRHPRLLAGALA